MIFLGMQYESTGIAIKQRAKNNACYEEYECRRLGFDLMPV